MLNVFVWQLADDYSEMCKVKIFPDIKKAGRLPRQLEEG
jgi:hypothetical protein